MLFLNYLGQYLPTSQHSLVLKLKLFTTVINGICHREIVPEGDLAAGIHKNDGNILDMVQ